MTAVGKKIAIVYLTWADEPERYLERALQGIAAQSYNHADLELVIVYNPKSGLSSAVPFIEEKISLWKEKIPHATILEQSSNLGFSGGNNAGMDWAVDHGFDYVFLHNADGYLEAQAISKMNEVMSADTKIGAVQSLILLYPQTNLINSTGNHWQYLGVGYCDSYRRALSEVIVSKQKKISYASGAAVLLRCDLLKQYGNWNEDFFMYHEDTEYSLRLTTLGYEIVLAGEAIFYHEYEFLKSLKKYYWLERNRHALKLMFYRWPTLILLFPLELVYNLGLLAVSCKNGWFGEYFRAILYWFSPGNWRLWLRNRARIQKQRIISDRQFLRHTVKRVEDGGLVVSRFVSTVSNMIFTAYYYLLRLLVWW